MLLHITGAAGSGCSTLASALARDHGLVHLETDDFFWAPTDPPYQVRRSEQARRELLAEAMRRETNAVIAGSVMGWGDEIENAFDLVVFLYLDTRMRIERLRKREIERFGQVDEAFIEWAAQYDGQPSEGRSLARHRAWLAARTCPVVELAGDLSIADRVAAMRSAITELC